MRILFLLLIVITIGCEAPDHSKDLYHEGDEITIKITGLKGQVIQNRNTIDGSYVVRYSDNNGIITAVSLEEYEIEKR